MKYKTGDLFVDAKRGVITVVEQCEDNDNWYKCNFYNKIELTNTMNVLISETDLNLLRECNLFRFYPTKI